MEKITTFFTTYSETFNIILSLVVVFQWIDKRSKEKWLEYNLGALKEMSLRLTAISTSESIQQKSLDIVSVIDASILTMTDESKKEKYSFPFLKNGKHITVIQKDNASSKEAVSKKK